MVNTYSVALLCGTNMVRVRGGISEIKYAKFHHRILLIFHASDEQSYKKGRKWVFYFPTASTNVTNFEHF